MLSSGIPPKAIGEIDQPEFRQGPLAKGLEPLPRGDDAARLASTSAWPNEELYLTAHFVRGWLTALACRMIMLRRS